MRVPERFFRPFVSVFPSEDTLRDPAQIELAFRKAGILNLVEFTSLATALRVESIGLPNNLIPGAVNLFENASGYIASVAGMGERDPLPSDILTGAQGFAQVAASLGAFEQVPIVGAIVGFVLNAAKLAINTYGQSQTVAVEAVPMGYSKASDEDYTRSALALYGGGDLTSIFLPANDASGGVGVHPVEVSIGWTGSKTVVERSLFVPHGNSTGGLGALPNTALNPLAWQVDHATVLERATYESWGRFKPAFTQSTMQSWQGLLANSRATYLVDAVKLADGWADWTRAMVEWASSSNYNEATRRRIAGMLISTTSELGTSAIATLHAAGYTQVLPWSPRRGEGINVQPTVGDFGRWAARVQLGARQRKYLGTLTVAYCSENDPAFRSDNELAKLLADRRLMLLNHPDVVRVDLDQVVDADYRAAVAVRQGPKGLKQAPGDPSSPGGITSGDTGKAAPLPPVILPFKSGGSAPFLGKTSGRYDQIALLLFSLLLGGAA